MTPLVLAGAVALSLGWLIWLWLSRARRVSVAAARVRGQLAAVNNRRGAVPQHAIPVASAASIEPTAEREPCPWCDGALHVDQHETEDFEGKRLRRVDAKCGSCSRSTVTWFFVEPVALPN